jgi:predicted Ser/Thr protein kinase
MRSRPRSEPVSSPSEPETLPPRDEPSAVAGAAPPPAASAGGFEVGHVDLPARFGRYRLEKVLGKGGMGSVYLAYDTQLDRHVALKVPMFGGDEDGLRERFFREARAAATLRHPNLCPVYDIGEQDGVYYLTMAFIEGTSLAQYLHAHKPLPPREAVELVRVLAHALQEAHDHGIIHRDLKPGNVLLSNKNEPIVTDFGLARRTASQDERLTQTGAILGTPTYMPPEQVNGDVAAMGPGCDIYALGVILYELLTGRPPFQGPMGTLIAQIVLDAPPPPSRFRPELDPALGAICLKALAKRPEERYPSMSAFAAALEAWLAGKASPPARAVSKRPRALAEQMRDLAVEVKTVAKPRSRKRQLLWLIGICTVILVLCVLPVGWIILNFSKLVDKVSDKMTQAAGRFKEQEKEQDHLRQVRRKEQQQLEKLARTWKAPAPGQGLSRLLPAVAGAYRLLGKNRKADLADLNLKAAGQRATYRGPAGTVELFVYRASELEKEAIFQRALEAVTRRGGVPGLTPGSASTLGSVKGNYLSYDLGPASVPAERYGTLWWQGDWLFLARGASPEDAGAFLPKYLAQVSGS